MGTYKKISSGNHVNVWFGFQANKQESKVIKDTELLRYDMNTQMKTRIIFGIINFLTILTNLPTGFSIYNKKN